MKAKRELAGAVASAHLGVFLRHERLDLVHHLLVLLGELLAVIAEMMRGHLSQIMSCSPMDLPLPDPGLIDHLMSATGRLSIHPMETDVYPEFIDLGLALPETEVIGPATTSVVFDRCSRTWHAE